MNRLGEMYGYLVAQGYDIVSLRGVKPYDNGDIEVVWADGAEPDLTITEAMEGFDESVLDTAEERLAAVEDRLDALESTD